MADRKVLNKYFPKNFDHERIVKRGRGKDKLMIVRNMLPMSLRCNTCSNYLYIGTKFNMRMEICNDEVYLGIKVFRFYLKCTYCYADITFKTDPKNHDYVVELGGTRNYEPIKDAQQAQKLLKKMKINQKQGDSMKYLQNKTYDSKREMQLMQTLQDIKNLNKRQGVIDPEDLLKNIIQIEQQEQKQAAQEEQIQIDQKWEELCRKNLQRKIKEFNQPKDIIHQQYQQQYQNDAQVNNQNSYNVQNHNSNFSSIKIQQPYLIKNIDSMNNNSSLTNNYNLTKQSSSSKKFIMPVIKSKLDKFKKKIIKKQQKDGGPTSNNNGNQQQQQNQHQQQNRVTQFENGINNEGKIEA